jgi:hypothetical protein
VDEFAGGTEAGEAGADDDYVVAGGFVALSAADGAGQLACGENLRLGRRIGQAEEKQDCDARKNCQANTLNK